MIEIHGLGKDFKGSGDSVVHALRAIDLEVKRRGVLSSTWPERFREDDTAPVRCWVGGAGPGWDRARRGDGLFPVEARPGPA